MSKIIINTKRFGNKFNAENPVDKDVEITLYRTIVAILDKASMSEVLSVQIIIQNTNSLMAVVEIKSSSDFADKYSLHDQGFESYQKRIELLGGHILMQKLRDGKVILTIKF